MMMGKRIVFAFGERRSGRTLFSRIEPIDKIGRRMRDHKEISPLPFGLLGGESKDAAAGLALRTP